MKQLFSISSLFIITNLFSQGIVNNGANIVMSGAASIYIDGGTDGDYLSQNSGSITPSTTGTVTLEGDWTNNSTNTGFTADAGLVILNGAAQSIYGTNSTTFYNLTLQGTGTKTQNINTTVGGVTTKTGVMALGTRPYNLNSFILTLTNPLAGAITNSTGYVISETNLAINPSIVSWQINTNTGAHVYPFGTTTGIQLPFTFNKTSAGASTIAASTRPTLAATNLPWAGLSSVATVTNMYAPIIGGDGSVESVIDRWWDITATGATTANVTFSYLGSENTLLAPYNIGNLGAQHWNGTGWDVPVGSAVAVTSGVGSVTANGLFTFSPWVLSSVIAPLPIQLLNFDAKCNGDKTIFEWCTASEINNNYFTIEQSIDGVNFVELDKISGSGSTTEKKCYNYIVTNLIANATYFRLTQTDFNLNTTLHSIIAQTPCSQIKTNVILTNDASNTIGVIVNATEDAAYTLKVHNALGQFIEEKPIYVKKGFNNISIKLDNVANAVYYVSLVNNEQQLQVKKIIIYDAASN